VNQSLYKNPLYNAATDFAPVMLIIEQPLILTARKDFPADNLEQFITYVRANQSRMQYGSGGAGSTPHLACALLNTTIGVEVTHVPYRGTGPAAQDLIAGRIDYMCPLGATAIPQIAAGQIKPIAILSKSRSPLLPMLASAEEQGLAGFEASTWNAAFLPKGTPRAIVQKLHDATEAAIDSGSVQEQLKNIGASVVTPERRSPEYLAQFVESEIAKWATPIKAAGIHGE
jgi:tripartite-type tricarboxylate transporter receptor subunit TctC